MRIIAGKYKGRALISPPKSVRPTSALVRGAVFNTIAQEIEGASFLDLCAGSGAMGLEAASRGAVVTIVEKDPQALKCIHKNIAICGASLEVLAGDALRILSKMQGSHFSFIYLDPPYREAKLYEELLLLAGNLLEPGGLLFVEGDREVTSSNLRLVKKKRYGSTYLTIFVNV